MAEYIEREAFIEAKRKQYCADCDRRKGMKNGKMRFCYEIGDAPCRACDIDDMLNYVEDFPAADVVEVKLLDDGTLIVTTDKYPNVTRVFVEDGKTSGSLFYAEEE